MTNKEARCWQLIAMFTIGSLIGMLVGGAVTDARINSEIRTDQIELKEQVAEIIKDETIIEDIVKMFLFETELLRLERQRLKKLQERLSKGEKNEK